MKLGWRLHQEACERGLGRAKAGLAVADGAPWIWNVVQNRWSGAIEVLDFYHASQHLWNLGEAVCGTGELARAWVEDKLHQLRHGRQAAALRDIAALPERRGSTQQIIQRGQNWLAHRLGRCRISVSLATGVLQTFRPVLDRPRPGQPVRLDRGTPKRPLEQVVELLMGSRPNAHIGR